MVIDLLLETCDWDALMTVQTNLWKCLFHQMAPITLCCIPQGGVLWPLVSSQRQLDPNEIHYCSTMKSRSQLLSCRIFLFKRKYVFSFYIMPRYWDANVVEIHSQGREQYFHCMQSITWLLMPWWHKEPGHQQPWYWSIYQDVFWFQHQNG